MDLISHTERGCRFSNCHQSYSGYENYGSGSIYYSNSVGIGTTVLYNLDVRKGSIGVDMDTLVAQHSDVVKEVSVVVASKTNDHGYMRSRRVVMDMY